MTHTEYRKVLTDATSASGSERFRFTLLQRIGVHWGRSSMGTARRGPAVVRGAAVVPLVERTLRHESSTPGSPPPGRPFAVVAALASAGRVRSSRPRPPRRTTRCACTPPRAASSSGTPPATGPLANEAAYRTIAPTEFNQVTAENAMKWDATEPSDGNYTFAGADQIVAFAPPTTSRCTATRWSGTARRRAGCRACGATAMRTAMQDHIATVVGRYANNAVRRVVGRGQRGLRRQRRPAASFWYNTLGQSLHRRRVPLRPRRRPERAAVHQRLQRRGHQRQEHRDVQPGASAARRRACRSTASASRATSRSSTASRAQMQQNLQRFADARRAGADHRARRPHARCRADATKDATQATYYSNVVKACLAVTGVRGRHDLGLHRQVLVGAGHLLRPGRGAAVRRELRGEAGVHRGARRPRRRLRPGPDTTPPTTPGSPVASGVTSSGLSLSWTASSDDVGVTGYEILRATGASGGTFAVVGTSSSASFMNSGLSASTTYRYQVRARDAAGNLSSLSPVTSATTSAGGGGPGPGPSSCRVAYTISPWGGASGFTAGVVAHQHRRRLRVCGWTLAFTLPSGQRVTPPGLVGDLVTGRPGRDGDAAVVERHPRAGRRHLDRLQRQPHRQHQRADRLHPGQVRRPARWLTESTRCDVIGSWPVDRPPRWLSHSIRETSSSPGSRTVVPRMA